MWSKYADHVMMKSDRETDDQSIRFMLRFLDLGFNWEFWLFFVDDRILK